MLRFRRGDDWINVVLASVFLALAVAIGTLAFGIVGGLGGLIIVLAAEAQIARRHRQRTLVVIEVPVSMSSAQLSEALKVVRFGEPTTILVEGGGGQPRSAMAVRCERRHATALMAALGMPI